MLPCVGNRDTYQFLFLGAEGSGKTTLLYKLKMGSVWKKQEIIRDLSSAKTGEELHYEEFNKNIGIRYGIWDIPGSARTKPLWPVFYRFIHINALFMIVNISKLWDQSTEAITETGVIRQWIQFLVHEDELREAAVVIVLNDVNDENAKTKMLTEAECEEILGIPDLQLVQKERIKTFTLNSADVSETSGVWPKILDFCSKQIAAVSK